MPRMRIENTTPFFERSYTVLALDRAASIKRFLYELKQRQFRFITVEFPYNRGPHRWRVGFFLWRFLQQRKAV
jgi:hypothetical protein